MSGSIPFGSGYRGSREDVASEEAVDGPPRGRREDLQRTGSREALDDAGVVQRNQQAATASQRAAAAASQRAAAAARAEFIGHRKLLSDWIDIGDHINKEMDGPGRMHERKLRELRNLMLEVTDNEMHQKCEVVFRLDQHSWNPSLVSSGHRLLIRALLQWKLTRLGFNELVRRCAFMNDETVFNRLSQLRPSEVTMCCPPPGRLFSHETSAVRLNGSKVLIDQVSDTFGRLLSLTTDLVTTSAMTVACLSPAKCLLRTVQYSEKVESSFLALCAVWGGYDFVDLNVLGLPHKSSTFTVIPASDDEKEFFASIVFLERVRLYLREMEAVLSEKFCTDEAGLMKVVKNASAARFKPTEVKRYLDFVHYVALNLALKFFGSTCSGFELISDHAPLSITIYCQLMPLNIKFSQLQLHSIWGAFTTRASILAVKEKEHELTHCFISDAIHYEADDFVKCNILTIGAVGNRGPQVKPKEVTYRLFNGRKVDCDLVCQEGDVVPRPGSTIEVIIGDERKRFKPSDIHQMTTIIHQDPMVYELEDHSTIVKRTLFDIRATKNDAIPVGRRPT